METIEQLKQRISELEAENKDQKRTLRNAVILFCAALFVIACLV